MLRLQTESGWWLITHPDHAHLAGQFASVWGNDIFTSPQPRAEVLNAIYSHDDGWAARDAAPVLTRQGIPAAFSVELVGKYSAFEEIDLDAYLTVRRNAVQLIARQDPYAAILISMHTYNLLTDRADRSTINPTQLPLLDTFLAEQLHLQSTLQQQLGLPHSSPLAPRPSSETALASTPQVPASQALTANFHLLQACDNLSLLSCVDFAGPATLLWPQQTHTGPAQEIHVTRRAPRTFQLSPCPFPEPHHEFHLRARFIPQLHFTSSEDLATRLAAAPWQSLTVTVIS